MATAAAARAGVVEEVLDDGGVSRRLVMVEVGRVVPSSQQPRRVFDEAQLKELAASIARSGLMQPVVVRLAPKLSNDKLPNGQIGMGAQGTPERGVRAGGGGVAGVEGRATSDERRVGEVAGAAPMYELVAGERRWRAAKMVGLTHVPAVVVKISDQESAEWAIVENVQRADLNTVEKARAFKRLSSQFGLTHAQIAERVGMDRVYVTNHLGLLEMPEEVITLVEREELSFAHARALMIPALRGLGAQIALAVFAAKEGWSLRRLDEMIKQSLTIKHDEDAKSREKWSPEGLSREAYRQQIEALEKRCSQNLGTQVRVRGPAGKVAGEGRGRLVIQFYSLEQFEGLMERFGVRGLEEK